VLTDALPILIFSGNIQFSYGTACGWIPTEYKGIVTKAQGTVVYEIDGKPALEFYRRYLGDRPPTAKNPLVVYESGIDLLASPCYMRVPTTSDAELRSIQFLGEIPEQALVQITEIKSDEW